jgi:hypothetical protein
VTCALSDQVRALLLDYPGVRVCSEDGNVVLFKEWDESTYYVHLTNERGHERGVWTPHHDLKEGRTEQLMLDLTEACDTLTRLNKETDE